MSSRLLFLFVTELQNKRGWKNHPLSGVVRIYRCIEDKQETQVSVLSFLIS